jgi:PAS domain-containing protein
LTEKTGSQFQYRSKIPFKQDNMYLDHKTALCACYADLNEEGEVETMMGFVMDISETKWVEEQLRINSEQTTMRYRNYAEHCPLGICRTDGDGLVLYGNDAWHQLYGLVRGQQYDSDSWRRCLDEDDVKSYQDFVDSFRTNAGPSTLETRLKNRTYTIKDGDTIVENGMWLLTTGFCEYKPDGSIDYIDFWVTDISSQKSMFSAEFL